MTLPTRAVATRALMRQKTFMLEDGQLKFEKIERYTKCGVLDARVYGRVGVEDGNGQVVR